MLSIEELRKDIPELSDLTDQEIEALRDKLSPMIENILDHYIEST